MTLEHAVELREGHSFPITGLSESEYYRLLANDCRRQALAILQEVGPALTVEELAADIADESSPDHTSDVVAIELHHVHLPMLDDAGVVTYDPLTRTVEQGS